MNILGRAALLLLCVFNIATAFGQDVIYSEYQNYDLRSGDFSVVGKVAGKLYTYRSTKDGFFLDIWNDSMTRSATVILDFFPVKIYETKFIAYPDKIVTLYQSLERGKVIQYAAKLDATGRLLGDPVKIDSAKTGFFGANKDYFSSAVSDDKHYVAIYGVSGKGDELNLGVTVLDDNLVKVNRFQSPFAGEGRMEHGIGLLGNDATFYIPAYSAVGSDDYAEKLWLVSRKVGEKIFVHSPLALNGKFAANIFFRVDNASNRIYAGGFYSDKKNGNYDGVIYAQYDINGTTFTAQKLIEFDDALKAATGERNAKRAFNNYQTRQLIVKKDGGFVMISEAYYTALRSTGSSYGYGFYPMYGPAMSRNIREYHYDDILALSYNGEGAREWHSFVRKDQYSQEDGGIFSSYALLNTGGTLGFLFNNLSSRRSSIQLATIDGDGKENVRTFAPQGGDTPDWLPRSGKQVAARELIVPCLRKRQICFAKVVF